MFTDHPRSLGMTWASHGAGAVRIGAELIGAGVACLDPCDCARLVHRDRGQTVIGCTTMMAKRKAGRGQSERLAGL